MDPVRVVLNFDIVVTIVLLRLLVVLFVTNGLLLGRIIILLRIVLVVNLLLLIEVRLILGVVICRRLPTFRLVDSGLPALVERVVRGEILWMPLSELNLETISQQNSQT